MRSGDRASSRRAPSLKRPSGWRPIANIGRLPSCASTACWASWKPRKRNASVSLPRSG